jgi:hypothetical protein
LSGFKIEPLVEPLPAGDGTPQLDVRRLDGILQLCKDRAAQPRSKFNAAFKDEIFLKAGIFCPNGHYGRLGAKDMEKENPLVGKLCKCEKCKDGNGKGTPQTWTRRNPESKHAHISA